MRGIAALVAAMAVWILVGAPVPRVGRRIGITVDRRAVAGAVAVGAVAATVAYDLTGSGPLAAAAAAVGAALPAGVVSLHTAKQKAAVADAWPDLIATIRSHLAAGRALPESFIAAARQAGAPFDATADRVSETLASGATFPAAMDDLRAELDDAMADRVLETLAAAHRSGGSRVSAILGALGTSVADELRLRKAHDAALTQQRLTATVALVAPWGLLALTITTNPQAAAAYGTQSGSLVIAAGLAATGLGYLLARRTAHLSKTPRVFE